MILSGNDYIDVVVRHFFISYAYDFRLFFEPLELLITEKNLPGQGGATSINFLFKKMEKARSLFGRDV